VHALGSSVLAVKDPSNAAVPHSPRFRCRVEWKPETSQPKFSAPKLVTAVPIPFVNFEFLLLVNDDETFLLSHLQISFFQKLVNRFSTPSI